VHVATCLQLHPFAAVRPTREQQLCAAAFAVAVEGCTHFVALIFCWEYILLGELAVSAAVCCLRLVEPYSQSLVVPDMKQYFRLHYTLRSSLLEHLFRRSHVGRCLICSLMVETSSCAATWNPRRQRLKSCPRLDTYRSARADPHWKCHALGPLVWWLMRRRVLQLAASR